ncbi:MAG: hypothetical protein RIF33_25295 [Cyclobacteriaceae bacterium]
MNKLQYFSISVLCLFFLLFFEKSLAQKSDIRVLTKSYWRCDTFEIFRPHDLGIDIISMDYPHILTNDTDLDTLINRAIMNNIPETIDSTKTNISPDSLYSLIRAAGHDPQEYSLSYKINLHSPYILSLTLQEHMSAGNGGNGWQTRKKPLTFDLVNKKLIEAKDIFHEHSCPEEVLRKEYDIWLKDHLWSIEKRKSEMYNVALSLPFAVFEDMVVFYVLTSNGGSSFDVDVTIDFKKYPYLFNENFLSLMTEQGR